MAVYLRIDTDSFGETREAAKERRRAYQNIRRPLRGIQVKPNTYAMLRVKTSTGVDIPLFDSSSSYYEGDNKIGRSLNYANFLIQNLTESRAEKQQIIETFGEDYVFFFGERPRFLDVSGVLINTQDFNWKSEFWTNYDQYLRGTKLVERNARLYFHFDDVVVEGYLIGASVTGDSSQPHLMPFQFQLFVTNYAILSNVGSVIFEASDTGKAAKNALEPIAPSMTVEKLIGEAHSSGGLLGFLSKTAKYANDASFAIQRTLETIRDTLYARPLIVPKGLGSQLELQPITNKAAYPPAPYGEPIYKMVDEYVERDPQPISADVWAIQQKENARVNELLRLRDPNILEQKVRKDFEAHGIDTGDPSITMMILGRGAFAAIQYAAPFGISRIPGGTLGRITQATGVIV